MPVSCPSSNLAQAGQVKPETTLLHTHQHGLTQNPPMPGQMHHERGRSSIPQTRLEWVTGRTSLTTATAQGGCSTYRISTVRAVLVRQLGQTPPRTFRDRLLASLQPAIDLLEGL